jgi:hypothetical protein
MSVPIQIIVGRTLNLTNASTRYICLDGGGTTSSVEATFAGLVSSTGTFKSLKVEVSNAPGTSGSGKKWDFTIYKNGASTGLTVTILETATSASIDFDVAVSPGDAISLQSIPTSAPTTPVVTWACEYIPTENKTLLMGSTAGATVANNYFIGVKGSKGANATEFNEELIIPCAGTIDNFYIRAHQAVGAGNSTNYTVRKNGADTTVLITLAGASQVTGNDLTHSFTVAAGDSITIQRTGSTTTQQINIGLNFTPDTIGYFILGRISLGTALNGVGSSKAWEGINCPGLIFNSPESNYDQIFYPCTIKNIYVEFNSSEASDITLTLRQNLSNSGLAVTMLSGNTIATAATDITVAENDKLDTEKTTIFNCAKIANISYTGYNLLNNTTSQTINSDAKVVNSRNSDTLNSDSLIKAIVQNPIISNTNIRVNGQQQDLLSDAKIIGGSVQNTIASDATIKKVETRDIFSDAVVLNSVEHTILSDAKIVNVRQQDITSDATISERKQEDILADATIKRTEPKDITSDAKVVERAQSTITSDSAIKHIEDSEILSDAKIVNRIQKTINSNTLIRAVKYFYGQLQARITSTKNFFAQVRVGQPVPIDPTGVVLTDLFTGDAVEITWTDSGNYGYNVYKDVGGVWTKLNSSVLVGATNYIAGALVTGVSYTFKIVGVNGLGVESAGVTGSKAPTFNAAHYTDAAYIVNISGVPLANVVLDTVELVYGPQYSTSRFHLNILPSTVGLPTATKQEVTIYIRGRLVFTGRLVRRENSWTGSSLQVNYTAIDKSWDYTWTTPICAGFQGLGFGWGSDGLINSLLRGMGLPTGLPIKNSLQNSSFYDQTYREIMSSFASECGSWVTHTDEYGIVRYYEYGHPVFNRTYTLGVNILEYKDTTDVTDQVDKIVVRSPAGRSFEEKYVSQTIQGLLISSAEMTDVAEPNRSGSPIPSSYDSSIPQPWLAGPTGWTRAGITGRAQYIQTSYDSKPFLAFSLAGYTDISDLRIEAFVNDRPEIIEPEVNSAGQQLEVSPTSVGETMWATGTTENRPCANRIQKYAAAWKPVSAQTVMVGGTMYVRIDEIPVVFEDRIVQTSRTTSVISPSDASISSTDSNVMYMEEPWQRIASIRVTFTHAGMNSSGSYGAGTVQRSQLLSTYDELTDRAHEIYSRLQHDTIQGSMSILGDETLTLRTHVNALEVMRITHDFSNGFRTHLDLTTPQNLYVLEVEKNYRDQVVSRDINLTTEAVFNSAATNGSGTSGGSGQDKKRNIRTSGASWGD